MTPSSRTCARRPSSRLLQGSVRLAARAVRDASRCARWAAELRVRGRRHAGLRTTPRHGGRRAPRDREVGQCPDGVSRSTGILRRVRAPGTRRTAGTPPPCGPTTRVVPRPRARSDATVDGCAAGRFDHRRCAARSRRHPVRRADLRRVRDEVLVPVRVVLVPPRDPTTIHEPPSSSASSGFVRRVPVGGRSWSAGSPGRRRSFRPRGPSRAGTS